MSFPEMSTIGQYLRESRRTKGLSQAAVAKQLGLRRATISDMERGVYRGVVPPLFNYLNLLGLTLDIKKQPSDFPQLSDLDRLFSEDDS